jgi:hypothetical protein
MFNLDIYPCLKRNKRVSLRSFFRTTLSNDRE